MLLWRFHCTNSNGWLWGFRNCWAWLFFAGWVSIFWAKLQGTWREFMACLCRRLRDLWQWLFRWRPVAGTSKYRCSFVKLKYYNNSKSRKGIIETSTYITKIIMEERLNKVAVIKSIFKSIAPSSLLHLREELHFW